MDPIQMIKDDHNKIKDLFDKYNLVGEVNYSKDEIAGKIFDELEIHMDLEEEIFYPAVENAGQDEMVAESVAEHETVKMLINELRDLDPIGEEYRVKMKVMQDQVEHHVQEEEDNMLPFAQENLQEQMEQLADEMIELKKEIKEAETISIR